MSGQVALVTGSSRGIGLAAAVALAREGFAVAVNGPMDDDELSRAVQAVRDIGGEAMPLAFDVTDAGNYRQCLDAIESTLGELTTLVNNAGVGVVQRGDPLDVTEESWDRVHTVNAKAVFFLTQEFARRLLVRTRQAALFYSIINVTSANAVAVSVPRSEYCASKAAASMVSRSWAARLGDENIAVYDVQPGLVETAMTEPVIAEYKRRAEDGLTLIPRVGQPEDVGAIIASLAAGKLPYTTGQTIHADGGMLVSRF